MGVVYSRNINGKELNFEASGGLKNASLIMRDKETNSFWSILEGKAIGGELKGFKLEQVSTGQKTKWGDWVVRYPNTKVLSINGNEDGFGGAYSSYFKSKDGFRGVNAKDVRLKSKEPIFAFFSGNKKFAISHKDTVGGVVFSLSGKEFFIFRKKNESMFASTQFYSSDSAGFLKKNGKWLHTPSGCFFHSEKFKFDGAENCPKPFSGFDTFWYNWSLNNPDTVLLP